MLHRCLISISLLAILGFNASSQQKATKNDTREYWLSVLLKISDPVLTKLSTLKPLVPRLIQAIEDLIPGSSITIESDR